MQKNQDFKKIQYKNRKFTHVQKNTQKMAKNTKYTHVHTSIMFTQYTENIHFHIPKFN